MFTALTIAGSDSSGGAGIQADIKTMTAHRAYVISAITASTALNTTGVTDIMEETPKSVAEQLDSIFTDINPDAIKTGMVSSSELIETIADKLTEYHAKNIVVDPVMVATSGARLISEEAIGTLKSKLLPLATVITPNIPEAEVLSEMEIKTEADMEKAEEIRYGIGNKQIYQLRKETIERIFGTAKEQHGFRYTQYIGKARMEMKAGLTFACMNLKKLAKILEKRGWNTVRFLLILKKIKRKEVLKEKWCWA